MSFVSFVDTTFVCVICGLISRLEERLLETLTVITATQDPERYDDFGRATLDVWPEFMLHSAVSLRLWQHLTLDFPDYQFLLLNAKGQPVAMGNSIPFRYEGGIADLPDEGWEWVLQKGVDDLAAGREPNMVSALQIKVATSFQGQGSSHEAVRAMRRVAAAHGFDTLVAPVRPSLKPNYPLIPIERYAFWTRADGLPFDPWLRVHARLGGEIVRACPKSMRITGTVEEWEAWTGMAFPESGTYTVPGALEPVEIDRERDVGVYVEPNVWVCHQLSPRED